MRRFLSCLALALFALVAQSLFPGCNAFDDAPCATQADEPGPLPPVSEAELRASWADSYGDLAGHACLPPWVWEIVTPAEQTAMGCPSDTIAGCTLYTPGPSNDQVCPLTITTAEYGNDVRLARHEFAHYALKCSVGDSDHDHVHFPQVWAEWVPGE